MSFLDFGHMPPSTLLGAVEFPPGAGVGSITAWTTTVQRGWSKVVHHTVSVNEGSTHLDCFVAQFWDGDRLGIL